MGSCLLVVLSPLGQLAFGVRAVPPVKAAYFRAVVGSWDERLAALPCSGDARRDWRLPAAGPSIGFPRRNPGYYSHLPSDTIPFGGVRDPLTSCRKSARMPSRGRSSARSERAATLAARLDEAAAALIAVVAHIETDRWRRIPAPGVWSIGKDAEHVIEAAGYHQWIVASRSGRRCLRDVRSSNVSSSPPTCRHEEAVALLRRRTEEGGELILGLTDEQLNLPTRPPRARSRRSRRRSSSS